MELFTSFDGRINRQPFWIGSIVLTVVAFIAGFILGFLTYNNPVLFSWGNVILSLILLYPALALSIKRLHDRDKPAMPWVVIFYGPIFLSQILGLFGIGVTNVIIEGQSIPMPDTFGWILLGLIIIVAIWALVELGFLKGTSGPNQFGPDPLM